MSELNKQMKPTDATLSLLSQVQEILEDYKAQQTVIMNVKGRCPSVDYFVLTNATSSTHMNAMAEALLLKLKRQGSPAKSSEGLRSKSWVAIDLENVIVHIFKPETRDYYQVEELWEPPVSSDNS